MTEEAVRFWRVYDYLIIYDPAMKPLGIARIVHGSRDVERLLRKE